MSPIDQGNPLGTAKRRQELREDYEDDIECEAAGRHCLDMLLALDGLDIAEETMEIVRHMSFTGHVRDRGKLWDKLAEWDAWEKGETP